MTRADWEADYADGAHLLDDLSPETRQVFKDHQVSPGSLAFLSTEARQALEISPNDVSPQTEGISDEEQLARQTAWIVDCLSGRGLDVDYQPGESEYSMQAEGITERLEATEDDEICTAASSALFPLRPPG